MGKKRKSQFEKRSNPQQRNCQIIQKAIEKETGNKVLVRLFCNEKNLYWVNHLIEDPDNNQIVLFDTNKKVILKKTDLFLQGGLTNQGNTYITKESQLTRFINTSKEPLLTPLTGWLTFKVTERINFKTIRFGKREEPSKRKSYHY